MTARTLRLSMTTYLFCVVLATSFGFGVMMLFRPAVARYAREVVGLEPRMQVSPTSFYALRVAPVLDENCVSCHGPRRQKAKLRLDTYADVLRGGRHGPVVKPGKVNESDLYARITLPAANERAMPPDSRPPMPAGDVTIIKLWIAAGASGVQPPAEIKGAPAPVRNIRFTEIDEDATLKARAPLSNLIAQTRKRYPGLIEYESRGSANLELHAAQIGAQFGDADLAAIAPLADHIVFADFSGTKLTDAARQIILTMRSLRTLRLNDTSVTDGLISGLTELNSLRSVTLIRTAATPKSISALRAKGVRVYDGREAPELALRGAPSGAAK